MNENNNSIAAAYAGMENISRILDSIKVDEVIKTGQILSEAFEKISIPTIPQGVIDSVERVSQILSDYYMPQIDLTPIVNACSVMTNPAIFESFSKIAGVNNMLVDKMAEIATMSESWQSTITNLQQAAGVLDIKIDSIFEDWDYDFDDESIDSVEEIIKGELDEAAIRDLDKESDGKIRECVKKFLIWLLRVILEGFVVYCFTSVYKTVADVFVYKNDSSESAVISTLPENSEVTVWSDVDECDYVEISYGEGDSYIQGYITKQALEEQMVLISKGTDTDEILFSNKCVNLMAEYWDISVSDAYERLSVDTDIINVFIVKNYGVLSSISEDNLVKEIDKEYNRIVLDE